MDTTDSAYGDKLIRLDTFDTAVAVDPSAEDDAKRRFMTLILQAAYHDGGNIGHVLRATNTNGEVFAVKLLKDNAILSGQAPDRSAEQSAAHLASTAALPVGSPVTPLNASARPAGTIMCPGTAAIRRALGVNDTISPMQSTPAAIRRASICFISSDHPFTQDCD